MIEEFKTDLANLSSLQLIRKYIYNGECSLLPNDLHFQLKEEICEYFQVDFNQVIVVGSAKLGFSIKPSKRYAPFGEESDIDVAVVATPLFEKIWTEAFLYKKSRADWPASSSFFRYLSQGWIRPDKLPSSDYFSFTKNWWDFFNEITLNRKYGAYKIRAGLYHSNFFLEEYQKICLEQCIEGNN
jgi:hypothetical protein